MSSRYLGCSLAGVLIAAGSAQAAQPAGAKLDLPPEALEARAIEKWQANGSEGIWLQVAGGRWLHARFQQPCADLPTSVSARFRWTLSPDLQLGAAVMTAAGASCAVRQVDRVKGPGSTAPLEPGKDELEAVVVEGREIPAPASQDVPQCGLRSVVWALTRPQSAWRLIAPVENTSAAAACVPSASPGYRWGMGIVP